MSKALLRKQVIKLLPNCKVCKMLGPADLSLASPAKRNQKEEKMAAQPILSSAFVLTPEDSKMLISRVKSVKLTQAKKLELQKFGAIARKAYQKKAR